MIRHTQFIITAETRRKPKDGRPIVYICSPSKYAVTAASIPDAIQRLKNAHPEFDVDVHEVRAETITVITDNEVCAELNGDMA